QPSCHRPNSRRYAAPRPRCRLGWSKPFVVTRKVRWRMAKIDRDSYFDPPVGDPADVLHSPAPVMGRRAEILEKDIWLCQVLGILFQLPCRKPMAFKGGTSLSKVYKAIDRFSEDIDVTVDYRSLVADAPKLESITSNNQRGKLSDALKAALTRASALCGVEA